MRTCAWRATCVRRGWKGDFELEEIAGSLGAEWISKELPKLKAQGYVRVGNSRFFKKPASVIAKKKGTKGTAAKKAAKKAPAKKKAEAETVLKTENLSSSIDSGILTPCFKADSTSSFDRPFPDSSFN